MKNKKYLKTLSALLVAAMILPGCSASGSAETEQTAEAQAEVSEETSEDQTAADAEETQTEDTAADETAETQTAESEEAQTNDGDATEDAESESASNQAPEALVWESEAESAGEVKATRTYLLQNAMDSDVTELYVYPSDSTEKGENLAGDGLVRGEQVYVTVTGYMLRTENETLYTIEYVADGETYSHTTVHVEDQLNDKVVYLVGMDGVSSATALSFSGSNLPDGDESALAAEAIAPGPQEDTPETRGEVKATRTYTLRNAMDETVTELYVYPSDSTEKGENLAGDGLEPGEPVRVTLTGYMLRTENETLYTIEYVAGDATYSHTTVHVEDLLFDTPIYLVGVDGTSSATALSFGDSNMAG